MSLPPIEPILVSDPGEEPIYALVCLIKEPELRAMQRRLTALRRPRSEYVVALAELLESGELALAYHDTYQAKVLGDLDAVKRATP